MANPRYTFRFDELQHAAATFAGDGTNIKFERDEAHGTSYHRAPVVISDDAEVDLASDGDVPFGALARVEADGAAVVDYHGIVTFTNGSTPVAAGEAVVADGSGGVRAADTGNGESSPLICVAVVGDYAYVRM